jgi:hypothetical protein
VKGLEELNDTDRKMIEKQIDELDKEKADFLASIHVDENQFRHWFVKTMYERISLKTYASSFIRQWVFGERDASAQALKTMYDFIKEVK